MNDPELLAVVADLKRRVSALEEMAFRKHRHRRCLERIVEKWPGPFTCQQIQEAVKEFHPEIFSELKPYAVSSFLGSLERAGSIARTTDGGTGCLSTVYELVGQIVDCGKRPGTKFNRRSRYESGFRHIVRTALADLPEEFTLEDLRGWMAKHMPDTKIPYGSWSSTLYKLTQSQELICIKGRGTNCSAERKVFTRGPRRVAASGEEFRELEASWMEFRKSMKTEVPEILPGLSRDALTSE